MPEGRLVELVDQLDRRAHVGEAYRHQGPGHPPLNAEGARIHGGRWNPKGSFPVLYLGLELRTVAAEFFRLAEKQGMSPTDLLPRRVYRYNVRLSSVLDLTDETTLEKLGLGWADIASDDASACQAVGDAAHYAGFEGLTVPSASGAGTILAVFFDQIQGGSVVEPVDFREWMTLPLELS